MFVLTRPTALVRRPSLARDFDRLFGGTPDTRTPALDVTETDTDYTVLLDVPGVTREQLKVSVEGRRVTVETVAEQATAPAATEAAPAADAKAAPRLLYRERSAARYARTVSLPAEVDAASAQARFDNGVLTLTLPKKVPTGARQLTIG